MENLKGQIVMTRSQRTDCQHQYTITVTDTLSSCVMIEVEMTPEEFAGALTSLYSTCNVALFNDSGKVGMRREHKTVNIDCSSLRDVPNQRAGARKLVAVHEVDGWTGEVRDTDNGHNRVSGNTFSVRFERWVKA